MGRTRKSKTGKVVESHLPPGFQYGDWLEYPFVVIHWMSGVSGVSGRRRGIFRAEGTTGFDGIGSVVGASIGSIGGALASAELQKIWKLKAIEEVRAETSEIIIRAITDFVSLDGDESNNSQHRRV